MFSKHTVYIFSYCEPKTTLACPLQTWSWRTCPSLLLYQQQQQLWTNRGEWHYRMASLSLHIFTLASSSSFRRRHHILPLPPSFFSFFLLRANTQYSEKKRRERSVYWHFLWAFCFASNAYSFDNTGQLFRVHPIAYTPPNFACRQAVKVT